MRPPIRFSDTRTQRCDRANTHAGDDRSSKLSEVNGLTVKGLSYGRPVVTRSVRRSQCCVRAIVRTGRQTNRHSNGLPHTLNDVLTQAGSRTSDRTSSRIIHRCGHPCGHSTCALTQPHVLSAHELNAVVSLADNRTRGSLAHELNDVNSQTDWRTVSPQADGQTSTPRTINRRDARAYVPTCIGGHKEDNHDRGEADLRGFGADTASGSASVIDSGPTILGLAPAGRRPLGSGR